MTRQIKTLFKIGSLGSRGLRSISPGSLGSSESEVPSMMAVIMLIYKIWIGKMGSVTPAMMAASSTKPSPRLVGSAHEMNLVRLS